MISERLEKRGVQAAWNRSLRARSSLEGTCAYRQTTIAWRDLAANRFGSLDCGVESTIEISILSAWQHSGAMRHDGRRSGTLNRELLTGLVEMLPGGLGQHEDTSWVERQTRVRAAVAGRWNRASVPGTRQRTSEIGVDSGKARPAPRWVRGGSVSSEAYNFIGLVCSIETTSIEADDSE